jgi:hypothetical protein
MKKITQKQIDKMILDEMQIVLEEERQKILDRVQKKVHQMRKQENDAKLS